MLCMDRSQSLFWKSAKKDPHSTEKLPEFNCWLNFFLSAITWRSFHTLNMVDGCWCPLSRLALGYFVLICLPIMTQTHLVPPPMVITWAEKYRSSCGGGSTLPQWTIKLKYLHTKVSFAFFSLSLEIVHLYNSSQCKLLY